MLRNLAIKAAPSCRAVDIGLPSIREVRGLAAADIRRNAHRRERFKPDVLARLQSRRSPFCLLQSASPANVTCQFLLLLPVLGLLSLGPSLVFGLIDSQPCQRGLG